MKKPSKLLFALFNVALLGALIWAVLHLVYAPAGMSIALTSNMENVQPGEWVSLRFQVLDADGEVVMDFERVHEKLLHLVVVREDLDGFQHIHPDFNKETGEFSVDMSFDEAGPYHLFADFTRENSTQTVLSFPVEVVGDYAAQTLIVSGTEAFTVEGMTVTPTFPTEITTGELISYSFDVTQDEETVSFEDYLGAKGHSVVLNEGELNYIHTHPEDDKLSFEAIFDEAGLYKSFTQFQVGGRVYTIEYVFEVTKGSAPVVEEEMDMETDHSEMSH